MILGVLKGQYNHFSLVKFFRTYFPQAQIKQYISIEQFRKNQLLLQQLMFPVLPYMKWESNYVVEEVPIIKFITLNCLNFQHFLGRSSRQQSMVSNVVQSCIQIFRKQKSKQEKAFQSFIDQRMMQVLNMVEGKSTIMAKLSYADLKLSQVINKFAHKLYNQVSYVQSLKAYVQNVNHVLRTQTQNPYKPSHK